MKRFVILTRSIVAFFLRKPLFPCTCRFAECETVFVDIDPCIAPGGSHVHKGRHRRLEYYYCVQKKSLVPVKDSFLVTKVSSYTHISCSCQCKTEIL